MAAVAAGAKIIERRITVDQYLIGSDHESSLNSHELRDFVQSIKIVEQAMGRHTKTIQACEFDSCAELGKTIVAARFLASGTYMSEENMAVKGSLEKDFHPLRFYELIGRRLKKAVERDESFMPSHFY
ncbi:sialic acid synthase-like [Argiope bruennichi]|uniref:sialic acid synthase-like n=1 Tax=Argiope bruennichi TaxID=94029 RepID=UPI002493E01C|nr:sialic acid synthase-like [Argiope bruennichi]